MSRGFDRENELASRLDMLIEEWQLTAEDLTIFARQARDRALLMRAETTRLRERVRSSRRPRKPEDGAAKAR